MNYFIESMFSIPNYQTKPSLTEQIYLAPLQQIFSQGLSAKDRKQLNKSYQNSDIFVKKTTIIASNIKKHKKYMTSAMSNPNSVIGNIKHTNKQNDSHTQQIPVSGREIFLQQTHPTDVQKVHEDDIFDYRLHMKLGKGEDVFKVQQVKRKQKKRLILGKQGGKQCQCCGKQFTKNHKCSHSICQRKCGKAFLRRTDSRRQYSSVASESKDQNWSQYSDSQQMKKMYPSNNSGKKDQKNKRNISSHHSSNKQSFYEPSQHLLASIQKLLTDQVSNNFTYRVIQIKEYQQQQQSIQDQMENRKFQNQEYSGEGLNENARNNGEGDKYFQQSQQEQHNNQGVNSGQQKAYRRIQLSKKVNRKQHKQGEQHIRMLQPEEQMQLENELKEEVMVERKSKIRIVSNTEQSKKEVKSRKEGQAEQRQFIQKDHISDVQSNMQNREQEDGIKGQKQQNNKQSNQNNNQQQPQNQPKYQLHANNQNKIAQQNSINNEADELQDLSIQEIEGGALQQQDQLQIKGQENNIEQQQNQQEQNNISEHLIDSEENSLDQEMDEIKDMGGEQQQRRGNQQQVDKIKRIYIPSKKKSFINDSILRSQQIEELNPVIQIQDNDDENQDNLQDEQIVEVVEGNTGKGKGKGKGRWMGRGKGILEQQLQIYEENSQLLKKSSQSDDEDYQELNIKQTNKIQQLKPTTSQPTHHHHHISTVKITQQSSISISETVYLSVPKSPLMHPSTPKRQVPNMFQIIQKMKQEEQLNLQQKQQKGLGRGKVFGRGLGVLEQAYELQKQQQADGLVVDEEEKQLQGRYKNGKKKIKTQNNKQVIGSNNGKNVGQQQQQMDIQVNNNSNEDDKFNQLIAEDQQLEIQQKSVNKQKINKSSLVSRKQQVDNNQQQDEQQQQQGMQQLIVQQEEINLEDNQRNMKKYVSLKQDSQQEFADQQQEQDQQKGIQQIDQDGQNEQHNKIPIQPNVQQLIDLFGGDLQADDDDLQQEQEQEQQQE